MAKKNKSRTTYVITVVIETREEYMFYALKDIVRCITRVVKETKYIFSL